MGHPCGSRCCDAPHAGAAPESRYQTITFTLRDLERVAAGETPLLEASSWWNHAVAQRLENMPKRPVALAAHQVIAELLSEFLSMIRHVQPPSEDVPEEDEQG